MHALDKDVEVGPTREGGALWLALAGIAFVLALGAWLTWLLE